MPQPTRTLITLAPSGKLLSIKPDTGTDLPEMLALNDAIQILDKAKGETCRMALPVFMKVNNAHAHLCKQLKEML